MLNDYTKSLERGAMLIAALMGGSVAYTPGESSVAYAKEVHKEYTASGGFGPTMMPGQGATLELSDDPELAKIQLEHIAQTMERKLNPYCERVTSNFLFYKEDNIDYLDMVVTCWDKTGDNYRKTYGINLNNACASFLDQTSILNLIYLKDKVITRTADGEATTSPDMGTLFNSDDAEFFAELVGRFLTANNRLRCRDMNKHIKIYEGPEGPVEYTRGTK